MSVDHAARHAISALIGVLLPTCDPDTAKRLKELDEIICASIQSFRDITKDLPRSSKKLDDQQGA